MRGSLLMAVVAGLVASTPETAFSKPRGPQPRRLYTSADDERKAMAQAKRDRKAAKRAAQQGASQ